MENLGNRLTILEYEFNHVVELLINKSQERWLPGFCAPGTNQAHFNRYQWVSDFVSDKKVLDLACGSGFGSIYLANEGQAKKVLAGDYSKKTIDYCKIKHKEQLNLTFEEMDAQNFSLFERMDVIISFETIEHLKNPDLLLKNCSECLNDNGSFFVSTPVSKVPIDLKPVNPHHLIEWNITAFRKLVQLFFDIENVFIQPNHRYYSSPLPLHKRINSKINRHLYMSDMKFIDYSIVNTKDELTKWQKLISLNFIDAYVILQCKKKVESNFLQDN